MIGQGNRHRRRAHPAAVALLTSMTALCALGAAEPDPPAQDGIWRPRTGATIESVSFVGLDTVDTTDVETRITVSTGDAYTPEAIRNSVHALYAMRVFSMIRVHAEPTATGDVALTWEFHERPRIVAVAFSGYKHFGESDLREKVSLKPGNLLDRRLLEKDKKALLTAYEDDGFPRTQVRFDIDPRDDGMRVVYQVDEGKRAKIRKILFAGNENIPSGDLRGELDLKKKSLFRSGRFTREKLDGDKERIVEYYRNHGYKDARVVDTEVSFKRGGEDLELTFIVEEGPLYVFGDTRWEGTTVPGERALEVATRVRRGEPFSQEKIDETLSDVYSLYTERGYLLGLFIDPELSARGDSVDVTFRVSEGEPSRVREISIHGNTRTREYVIRRELVLVPGDLLRRSALMRSQRDVMALGFFEEVIPDYRPVGDGTTDIDVVLDVKERTTGTASAGAGFSSDTGVTGFIDLGHNNLFGRGQAVQIHLERGSRRQDYRFSFTEPWLLGKPTSLGVDVFSTQRVLDLFTEDRRGAGIRVGRPWFYRWPDFSRISFAYSLENLTFSDLDELDNTSQEFLESGEGTISQFAVTFSRSSTDNPFYPTVGSVTRWRTEFAGGPLGGELDFVKSTLDFRHYFVPFWKPAIMLRHRIGHIGAFGGSRVPGNETFRLGGTTFEQLRGYDDFYVVPEENITRRDDGRLVRFPGGKFMFSFTAEYQFPIVHPLHGLLFFDAGNTWNAVDDFNLLDLKEGVGAGVRLEIPMLGTIGLDYAYGVDLGKWRTHLILGPQF